MTEILNDDSILLSIKKMLGLAEDYQIFDTDIVIHINSSIAILTQLGVGPGKGFRVVDETETWEDFLAEDIDLVAEVKDYIFLKVKMIFDPPSSSAVIDSMQRMINEYEWRLNVTVDPYVEEEEGSDDGE